MTRPGEPANPIADPFIDPGIRGQIDAELAAIERDQGVRILLAVESGSRAWRFASPDSDYDVRFVYLRAAEAYLTVLPARDVIERPVNATFDVNGWDLRKAFQLALRSNAVLLEWLSSPVLYRDDARVGALARFAREAADPTALAYHYDHQCRKSAADIAGAPAGEARLKTYCYALRAALALAFLRAHDAPPPMALPALIDGLDLPADLRAQIADLVACKRVATERAVSIRRPAIDAFVAEALARPVQPAGRPLRPMLERDADALFAAIVLGRAP